MSNRGGNNSMAARSGTAVMTQSGTQTLRQRGTAATQRLHDVLHLPMDSTDAKILGTALAEAVADEAQRDSRLANSIRQRYDELAALSGSSKSRTTGSTKQASEPLVPIRH